MPDLSKPLRNSRNNFWPKIIGLCILTISLILGWLLPNWLLITKVTITPTGSKLVGIHQIKGKSLVFLNQNLTAQTLLKKNPTSEIITVTKQYPNELKIQVTIAQAVAQIKTDGYFLIISSRGKILQKTVQKKPELITIRYYQKIRDFEAKPGQILINEDLLTAIKLIREGQKQQFDFKTVTITKPGQSQIELITQKTIITFNNKKNIAKSWKIVHNIISSLKIKEQSPKEINLVFEKPFFIL